MAHYNENLPGGCEVSDIPGNRPGDEEYAKWLEDEQYALAREFYEQNADAIIRRIMVGSLMEPQFDDFCMTKFKGR